MYTSMRQVILTLLAVEPFPCVLSCKRNATASLQTWTVYQRLLDYVAIELQQSLINSFEQQCVTEEEKTKENNHYKSLHWSLLLTLSHSDVATPLSISILTAVMEPWQHASCSRPCGNRSRSWISSSFAFSSTSDKNRLLDEMKLTCLNNPLFITIIHDWIRIILVLWINTNKAFHDYFCQFWGKK